jgi:uridine phosphorylase
MIPASAIESSPRTDIPVRKYHTQLEPGDVGEYVLLPGDPGRCELIATRFCASYHVRSNREYTTYTGTLNGVPVSVCSTGIGGPSTAIAVEELADIGAKCFIRVGTCGAMHESVRRGDLVVMNAAVREDGTSKQYAPPEFPAVSDFKTTAAILDSASALGHRYHLGVTVSMDAFYSELRPEQMAVEHVLRTRWEGWKRCGVLAVEMECGTLFVAAAMRGLRAGAICAAVNEAGISAPPDHAALSLDAVVDTAVGAIRRLLEVDAAPQ